MAVIAVIGVQLIAPYHAMTISNKSTHSSLKLFFENLYEDLCNLQVDETFFSLTSPAFKLVSDKLFAEVQKNYGLDVVKAVKEMAESHMNDYITLAQIMLSHLEEVLRSQRGKYYGFGDIEEEYPVFEQRDNIDQTPIHNLHMERQCGDTDHRLKKKASLGTVSRDSVLSQTQNLRGQVSRDYRNMGNVVKIMDDMKPEWKVKEKDLQEIGLSQKESNLLHIENRKLAILDRIKAQGGPFSSTEEIENCLLTTDDNLKTKTNRMRDEVTCARDTSSSLPKNNPVFRIMTTEGGRTKLLTPEQFAQNLKVLLGKRNQRNNITLADFQPVLIQQK